MKSSRLAILLATGFGLGYLPIAPGTWGTLLGVLIAVAIAPLGWVWQALIAVALVAAAVPVCDAAEKAFGTKDDGRIVADEYATFPLVLLGIPWTGAPWMLAVAFVTHRLLDIVKPPPARGLQAVKGGAGIVIDDLIASLYALALNHAIWWTLSRL